MARRSTIFVAVAAAALWGLWWIPIRALEDMGLHGPWAGSAMNLGCVPILVIAAMYFGKGARNSNKVLFGSAIIGMAAMLYASALTGTTIVRAVLLFYLAPAWAIGLEALVLGRKLQLADGLAMLLAFTGVWLIFGGQFELSGWAIGDSFALISGVCWAVGSTIVFTSPVASVTRATLMTCLAGAAAGAVVALALPSIPPPTVTAQNSMMAFLFGCLFLAPILVVTIWSAQKLPPALFSFLLTAEIIVGVASGAIWAGEHFGWFEALGAAVIASAALIETRPKKVE
jgi:drug/metabolite transporter (DMT)-like permease